MADTAYDTDTGKPDPLAYTRRQEAAREIRLIDQREFPPPITSWEIDRRQDDYEAAALGWGRGEL